MKDISGAMNQTSFRAINGLLCPHLMGISILFPYSQCYTVSQTGTYRAALLAHHLHFMKTETKMVQQLRWPNQRLLACPLIGPRRRQKHSINLLQANAFRITPKKHLTLPKAKKCL